MLRARSASGPVNYEFGPKCNIYFSGTKNVSSYALTSQVMAQDEWTPHVVEARQKQLLKILYENWAIEGA